MLFFCLTSESFSPSPFPAFSWKLLGIFCPYPSTPSEYLWHKLLAKISSANNHSLLCEVSWSLTIQLHLHSFVRYHGVLLFNFAYKSPGFDPWVGKKLWRWEWQSIPVLLPGESHRQPSGLWDRKELNTTEQLTERLTLPIPHFSSWMWASWMLKSVLY